MKTAIDYQLNTGTHSLNYYKFYTPGICVYKTKSKIIKALNLGIKVYMLDKDMGETYQWDYERENWIRVYK